MFEQQATTGWSASPSHGGSDAGLQPGRYQGAYPSGHPSGHPSGLPSGHPSGLPGTASTEAPAGEATLSRWLTQSLDHVGLGLLLVTDDARVLHANRLALLALGPDHPLLLDAGQLRGRCRRDNLALADALDGALHRSLRRMLMLGQASDGSAVPGVQRVSVAVLPIDGLGAGAALVSLPRPSRCRDLAVQCFARQQGFTGAETAVLEALLDGQAPAEIAHTKRVAVSTIRTQVGQLRMKSGSHSIRELLNRVGALPPMMSVLQ